MHVFLAIPILLLFPVMAFCQPDCQGLFKDVDARIASGKYPKENIEYARQLRETASMMCGVGLVDQKALDGMRSKFDEALPIDPGKLAELQQKEKARQEKLRRYKESTQSSDALKGSSKPDDQGNGQRPLIDASVEYSATSVLNAINPGGNKFKSVLNINHAPGMTRYTKPDSKSEAIRILRHDKNLVWIIHPEDKRAYPGLKLYQEFKLGKGFGLGPHMDHIIGTRQALKSYKNIINLGKDALDGLSATHYQKRERNRAYEEEIYNVTDYWVSDNGILLKLQTVTPESSLVMETKNIKLAKQSADLFTPPHGYEKRGIRISWSEEKRKLAAKNKKSVK